MRLKIAPQIVLSYLFILKYHWSYVYDIRFEGLKYSRLQTQLIWNQFHHHWTKEAVWQAIHYHFMHDITSWPRKMFHIAWPILDIMLVAVKYITLNTACKQGQGRFEAHQFIVFSKFTKYKYILIVHTCLGPAQFLSVSSVTKRMGLYGNTPIYFKCNGCSRKSGMTSQAILSIYVCVIPYLAIPCCYCYSHIN